MKQTKTKSRLFTNTEHKELFDYRLKGKKNDYTTWWKMKPKLNELVDVAEKHLKKIKELLNDGGRKR